MNFKLALAACVVLVAVHAALAGKGGPGGPGGPGGAKKEPAKPTRGTPVTPRAHDSSEESGERDGASVAGDRFVWNRVLSDSVSVQESAFVPSNSSVVLLRSDDKTLRSLNISKAVTVYDFSNNSKVEVVRVDGACYILETALSYQEIVDQLNARNNTNVTASDMVALNGTHPALTAAEAVAFLQQYPSLWKLCQRRRVIRTTSDVAVSPDTRIIEIITFTTRVSLTVNMPPKGLLGVLRGGKSGERKGH